MGKNSRGVAHVILLAIFIPIAIGLTLAFKTTFDKISSPSTPDSEEREISRSFFGDLLEGVGGALAPLSTQEPDAESATESEQATSPDSASAKDIAGDTTPPTITQMTGPADGSTISFNSFGFPIKASDNVSKYPNIWVRVKFDSDSWSGWSTN
ncbi:MAG: hypothetical protein GTN76_09330, partial [Candidatus Aenigmarchaeota archaeon]|nr:hypothetical protein [Candidatus Aenigmarchaeota archaeon]